MDEFHNTRGLPEFVGQLAANIGLRNRARGPAGGESLNVELARVRAAENHSCAE